MSGVAFTLILFAAFTLSERATRTRASAHAELDQFNLEPGDDLTPAALRVRPGSVLVPVRNYNTLYNLRAVLDRVDTHKQDVIVLHLRFLQRAGGGEYELAPEQLFSLEEQTLFTRGAVSEKWRGRHAVCRTSTRDCGFMRRRARAMKIFPSCRVTGVMITPSLRLNWKFRLGYAWVPRAKILEGNSYLGGFGPN
jgi:hypothetical protein